MNTEERVFVVMARLRGENLMISETSFVENLEKLDQQTTQSVQSNQFLWGQSSFVLFHSRHVRIQFF